MLRIRTPQLGDGGAASGQAVGAFAGTATLAGVGASRAAAAGAAAGSATLAGIGAADASAAGSFAGFATFAGTGASLAAGDGAFAGTSSFAGVAPEVVSGVGEFAGTSSLAGVSVPPSAEALPRGGFLPDDWEDREKRRKAIRASLEGVGKPKPAQVAEAMREAVAPASEPPAVTMRDAVSPATMEGLRRLAENARARHAELDDDDEDVLMLLGV